MKNVWIVAAFIFCMAGVGKAQGVNSTTDEQKIEKVPADEVVTGTDAKAEGKGKKCEGKKKCCKEGKKKCTKDEAACHKKKTVYNDKRRRNKELV